jgi:transitional endoplasmic reticulum ATPase
MSNTSSLGTNEVKLRVGPAVKKDAGRGLVRIDPFVQRKMNLNTGDVVSISSLSGKKTAAKIWPGLPEDENQGIIRMDGGIRRNVGVSIDEYVLVKGPIQVKPAQQVTLAPIDARLRSAINVPPYILEGMVLSRNDILAIQMMGGVLNVAVINFRPNADAVIIDSSTKVEILDKPASEVKIGPHISYEDVGGLRDEIQKIREMVELPIRHPEIFSHLGIDAPKGVLLYGPPGTGKTLLAKAVASETDAHFISLSGPEIMSKFYGQSE